VILLWILAVFFGLGCNNNFSLALFIFALSLKSISVLTYLWLPEAMEGPTPVSSLLHSCTLVMAGLFSAFNTAHEINFILLTVSGSCLVFLAFLSRPEQDAKRIVATSTIVMVCFL
jgi:NADH-quinone oxidoreductase subunit L